MSLGDLLGDLDKGKLFRESIHVGDVFLKSFEGIDHPKFFIVAGISQDKVCLCTVYINSNIHPSILKKQYLLDLQVPLKKSTNPFLKYDSFANCSTIIPLQSEPLSKWMADKSCKVIGCVFKNDLSLIVKTLKKSGLLSEEEITLYFP